MVEGADALLTLAEFAVALAGFMGIAMVFRGADAEFHPLDSHRIQVGLASTLGPAFLALLPAGLELAGLASALLWRLCSVLGALFAIGFIAVESGRRRRLPPAATALISSAVVRLLQILFGLSVVLQLVNASGLASEPRPGLYFLALVSSLAFGAVAFVRIVFIRPRGPAV